MTGHDALCLRWQERDGTYECRCDMVTEARADERERIAAGVRGLRPYRWGRVSKGMVLGIVDGPARIASPPPGAVWRIVWR